MYIAWGQCVHITYCVSVSLHLCVSASPRLRVSACLRVCVSASLRHRALRAPRALSRPSRHLRPWRPFHAVELIRVNVKVTDLKVKLAKLDSITRVGKFARLNDERDMSLAEQASSACGAPCPERKLFALNHLRLGRRSFHVWWPSVHCFHSRPGRLKQAPRT